MGRQGKLHSSPFHVESPTYKYAVEHEIDARTISYDLPECAWRDKTKTRCKKWNTGFAKCENHRCPLINMERHRVAQCYECAYCYEEICYHQNVPEKQEFSPSEAEYCCYYLDRCQDPQKYTYIQRQCERFRLSLLSQECRKRIVSKGKYIRQASKEIAAQSTSKEDRAYLIAKCTRFETEQAALRETLSRCENRLDELGGAITSLPWFKNKYKKK